MPITWTPAPTKVERRVACIVIYGPSGSGRTSLALTAAGPLFYLHDSEKKEFVVVGSDANLDHQLKHGHTINMYDFHFTSTPLGKIVNPKSVSASANRSVVEFEQHLADAMSREGSAIIDTAFSLWGTYQLTGLGSMDRDARDDDVKEMGQLVYAKINSKWHSMIKSFRGQDGCNMILLSDEKPVYVKKKKGWEDSGARVLAGQKHMWKAADVVIHTGNYKGVGAMEKNYVGDPPKNGYFYATIEKGWGNAASQGVTFYDDPNTPFGQRWINLPDILAYATGMDASEWGGPVENVEDEDDEPPSGAVKKTTKALKRKAVKK